LHNAKELQQLKNYHVTFSQEGQKLYVQDLLAGHKDYLADSIEKGAVLMICGSLNMRKGVYQLLDQMAESHSIPSIQSLEASGQLLADCY
jgi:sulfite reductase (NADPH) flavoprotein alpha-component